MYSDLLEVVEIVLGKAGLTDSRISILIYFTHQPFSDRECFAPIESGKISSQKQNS
jgi:hypothetical protein